MALVRSALKLRLAPTRDQEELLLQFAGARRWVWNWALDERHRSYAETGRPVSWSTLSARLTAMKREPQTRWLQDMDSQALQQALADLGKAFNAYLAGDAGLPGWRSRKTHRPTFRIPQRVEVTQAHIRVPKVGLIRLLQSKRPLFPGGKLVGGCLSVQSEEPEPEGWGRMGWGSRGSLPVGSAEVVTGRYNSPSHQPSRFSTVQDRRDGTARPAEVPGAELSRRWRWKGGGEEIREGAWPFATGRAGARPTGRGPSRRRDAAGRR